MEIPIIANHNNTKMEVIIKKEGDAMLCSLDGRLEGNASLAALIYRQAKDINLI